MDKKQVKRKLKDIALYCQDAAKSWPKHPETALIRLDAAIALIEDVYGHLEEENHERQ
jgi:hypothetical protein